MAVSDVVTAAGTRLTPTERRVAEVVVDDPSLVAFGTVATVAGRAGASGPSVLRLAAKLGFDGFVGLQAAVQEELASGLRPATERIRATAPADPLGRALAVEVANVRATLEGVDRDAYGRAVALLADRRAAVAVLAGEAAGGVAGVVAADLDLLRPDVSVISGSEVAVARAVARLGERDVVLAVEVRRYERWVLRAAAAARVAGARLVAVTDGPLSPLAADAEVVLVVGAVGAGPFDSYVGALALLNALVAGVAARLRAPATRRLDAVESAYAAAELLTDGC